MRSALRPTPYAIAAKIGSLVDSFALRDPSQLSGALGTTLTADVAGTACPSQVLAQKCYSAARYSVALSGARLTGAVSAVALIIADATTGTDGAVVACYGSTTTRWLLRVIGTTQVIEYAHHDSGGTLRSGSAGKVPLGLPTVIGFSRDSAGTGITIYVGGVAAGSFTAAAAPGSSGTPSLVIGGYTGQSAAPVARVEDVAVFSAALTARQHRSLAASMLRTVR